ncbi:hypothetical protein A2U01_0076421, partial [Trifolium medium]|nr:hypothetical protein [Trifolium medium]
MEIERINDDGGGLGGRWFGSMFRNRWGMGHIRFSGPIPKWMRLLCVNDLVVCMTWRRPNRVRWLRCFRYGGGLMGRRG